MECLSAVHVAWPDRKRRHNISYHKLTQQNGMLFYSNSCMMSCRCSWTILNRYTIIVRANSLLLPEVTYLLSIESFKAHLYSHEVAVSLRGHVLEHVALIQYQALQRELAKKFPVVWLTNTHIVAKERKENFH